MNGILFMVFVILVGWLPLLSVSYGGESEEFWGQWRGPAGLGLSLRGKPPIKWSEDNNVRWKRELPGEGASTPIVWGDMVYVQTAIPVKSSASEGVEESQGESNNERRGRGRRGHRSRKPKKPYKFVVMALERKTGKPVWERVVCEQTPHEGNHSHGSVASPSPVTDGKHIYAYFGSRGLYCLTMKGEVVWGKDFGDMRTKNAFGEGSSPVLYGDTIVVNWDHEGNSFIVALDKTSGDERWKMDRDEVTSWSTPVIIRDKDQVQVVVSASKRMRSYDLASGKVVWECGGVGSNCVASPVAGLGMVFAMSGHREPALLAVRYLGAKGDLTGSESVVWRLDKGTPYVPSPLLYDEILYFASRNNGLLSCYNARTGESYYTQQRLEELKGLYASLVGADGRVYIVGRNGVTYVLKHGPKFQVVAVNKLADRFRASPVMAGRELYLRGHKYLYCIASK
jgi:outer membrane protein assembly factor BamB